MTKKLPIYLSFIAMYVIIFIGLFKFYNAYKEIEQIIPSAETRTIVPIPILIIFSALLFIVLLSVAAQILVAFWEWLKDHKTAIVYPFLIIAIGVAQLSISVMTVVRSMIETNAVSFVNNLTLYIQSTESLIYWFIAGIITGAFGLGYEIYLKYQT